MPSDGSVPVPLGKGRGSSYIAIVAFATSPNAGAFPLHIVSTHRIM